jgi:hypothetical protein
MENLDKLLEKPAQEWDEQEILQIIEALREQRSRWNQEQSSGGKTRVPAAKIPVKPAKKDLAFEGLKL